ncbi:HdeD family acid-resistance protein [Halorientalis salina]|uniref:HdeD family acid-resistance protein n=1 Tax=Halorientalis salina TaxID=2932266 RepID=UPI0010AD3098|nr:HdeD family acid-resistance protein [Halorientalis salina]
MNSDNSDDTTETDSFDEPTEPQSNHTPGEPGREALAANRTLVMAVGVLVALLGVVAILSPFVTGVALTLVFGALLVAAAVFQTASAVAARGWSGFAFGVGLAALYAVAGVVLLVNPTVGLVTLTFLLGLYFLAEGIIQLLMGLRVRENDNWGWMLFSGIVSLLLSSLVLLEFPSSAEWAVGLLFGVNLLTTGVAMASLAMAATPEPATTTTGPVEEAGT